MVFKRRKTRSVWRVVLDALYPRGGWTRAFHYVRHRLNRLPDTPQRISRGVFAGVFSSFTPLFGFHFILALILSKIARGNLFAGLLGTFIGNPLTFPVIAALNLELGHFILRTEPSARSIPALWEKFAAAWDELRDNALALFSARDADWADLLEFFTDIWLPYLVGGLGPGILSGLAAYWLCVPVITAYQNHRRGKLKKPFAPRRPGGGNAKGGAGPPGASGDGHAG